MNQRTMGALAAIGLVALAWVGWGFVGSSALALVMTATIAAVYLLGVYELWQFALASRTLHTAVQHAAQPVPDLAQWLANLHPSLRASVRQRIDGERAALPAPALTPYLVGLLVMLGMLGTFLGMVVTFKGAAFALEGSTNLDAIRSALAAPIQGLGLSFGTSVAGVATSSLLGLLSALCRRDRLEAIRALDGCIATTLRPYSQSYQRETLWSALQVQALALPQLVEHMQALSKQLTHNQQAQGQQLLDQQDRFHADATTAYRQLASEVGASLQTSLQASAHSAAQTLRPVVQEAMTQLRAESQTLHERLQASLQEQQQAQLAQWQTTAQQVSDTWVQAAQRQQATQDALLGQLKTALHGVGESLHTHSTGLLQTLQTQAARTHDAQEQATAQLAAQAQTLIAHSTQAHDQWLQRHSEQLHALQATVAQHLATLAGALETPINRLLQSASEAPRAAAEVIAQLRQEMTALGERDNTNLAERKAMLEQVAGLLATVEHASQAQRTAIDTLVQSATTVLEQASSRFAQALDAQSGQVNDVATHVAASAIELSSLGQAFGHGVGLFGQSNDKLVASLQALEARMQQTLTRSDEQLAYYVAQAREVIDLSITSQQGLLEDMRRIHARAAEVAA